MTHDTTTREILLNDLKKLNEIAQLPGLYLAYYFDVLRNKVDKECALKQLELQNDKEKKNKLDELWQTIINKIDSFQKNCIRNIYDLDVNKIRINEIENKLNNEENIDFEKARDEIENEEINLLQNLFQNKTILFRKHSNHDKQVVQSEKKLIDGQLIVLDDEFINLKSIDER
jgi:flagellar biosynthesis/type III secretory pathway chaperone